MDLLRSLDLFPKTHDDFRVKTATGGILSIISVILMIALLIAETRTYLTPVGIYIMHTIITKIVVLLKIYIILLDLLVNVMYHPSDIHSTGYSRSSIRKHNSKRTYSC